jgi:hypothetical protein
MEGGGFFGNFTSAKQEDNLTMEEREEIMNVE